MTQISLATSPLIWKVRVNTTVTQKIEITLRFSSNYKLKKCFSLDETPSCCCFTEQWLISGKRVRSPKFFSWKNYLHPKNEWEVCCKKDLHLRKTVLGHFTDHSLYCVHIVPVSKKNVQKRSCTIL